MQNDHISDKCDFFRAVGLWPGDSELSYERWLTNFSPKEHPFARTLLANFVYFSEALTTQLFCSSFHSISRKLSSGAETYAEAEFQWDRFRRESVITRVTGEEPNDTDSGYQFARASRQRLGIAEQNILSPEKALTAILGNPERELIFVDDFLGSGEQFLTTWKRRYELTPGTKISFADLYAGTKRRVYYCCIAATEYGWRRVARKSKNVSIECAHILKSEQALFIKNKAGNFYANPKIWPSDQQKLALDFVRKSSSRAKIPAGRELGFHNLALSIAFAHSVPDATLPLYYWKQSGWKALKPRT